MDFNFYISKVLNLDSEGFSILDASTFNTRSAFRSQSVSSTNYNQRADSSDGIVSILDRMGEASSKAQGLKATITTYLKFTSSGDNRIYLKGEGKKVYGMLKTGKRNLFYHDSCGKVKEIRPLCVLDFYVHESVQRMGVGKDLFEKMLEVEKVEPHKLAYDRPSEKLVGFLKKHYNLVNYIPQNNNFVIFNQFFDESYRTVRKINLKIDKTDKMPSIEERIATEKDKSPLGKYESKQTELSNVGKKIIESNTISFKENYGRNAEFGRDLIYGKNESVKNLNSYPSQGRANFMTIQEDSNTKKISYMNKNLYGNGDTFQLKEEKKREPLRRQRDEIGLLDIDNKLKSTEDQIAKVQEKIDQLNKARDNLNNNNSNLAQYFRSREQGLVAPFANYGNNVFSNTSSQAYGKHLQSNDAYNFYRK